MPTLKYVGTSHFREISKADFKSVDLDHDAVKIARHDLLRSQNVAKHPQKVDVSDDVAEFLMREEPGDWKLVDESRNASDDEEAS